MDKTELNTLFQILRDPEKRERFLSENNQLHLESVNNQEKGVDKWVIDEGCTIYFKFDNFGSIYRIVTIRTQMIWLQGFPFHDISTVDFSGEEFDLLLTAYSELI